MNHYSKIKLSPKPNFPIEEMFYRLNSQPKVLVKIVSITSKAVGIVFIEHLEPEYTGSHMSFPIDVFPKIFTAIS